MTRTLAALALLAVSCSSAPPPRPAARPHTTRALPPEDRTTVPPTTAATTTTAARPRRAVRPTTTVVAPEGNEGAAAQQLAAIAACESGGEPTRVSRSGKYRGRYQFDQRTWNGVASRHRPDLVGADPAAASPADQDAMAGHLYDERGGAPWPNCG